MFFGMQFGSIYGGGEESIGWSMITPILGGATAFFLPTPGPIQNYAVVVDGATSGVAIDCSPGQVTRTKALFPTGNHMISITPCGDTTSKSFDLSQQQDLWLESRQDRFWLPIVVVPTLTSSDGQLSNWSLSGLSRSSMTYEPTGLNSLLFYITTSGGVHTIASNNNEFFGQRTGDGPVTLTGASNGTVDLTWTTDGQYTLYADYPAQYRIYYRNSGPYTGPSDFVTPQGTITDDGHSPQYWFYGPALTPGTWYSVVHQVSRNGAESTGLTNVPHSIVTVPEAPGTLEFNGTDIVFEASATPGATYNVYDGGITGVIDPFTPSSTLPAGTGQQTYTLSAVPGYEGYRYITIKAVTAGVEDNGNATILLTYIGGVVVLMPPTPIFNAARSNVLGRTLSAYWSVASDPLYQTPTGVALFLYPVGTDPDQPIIEQAIGTEVGGIWQGRISGTAPSDGQYMAFVVTKNGQSPSSWQSNITGPWTLSLTPPEDPV
jgi:hypothetical protein